MAKIKYVLACEAKNVEIVDGNAIITFERETDVEDVSDAEASGEYQSNMLWEIFGHSFAAYDDNGDEIIYDEEGEMK